MRDHQPAQSHVHGDNRDTSPRCRYRQIRRAAPLVEEDFVGAVIAPFCMQIQPLGGALLGGERVLDEPLGPSPRGSGSDLPIATDGILEAESRREALQPQRFGAVVVEGKPRVGRHAEVRDPRHQGIEGRAAQTAVSDGPVVQPAPAAGTHQMQRRWS
ncbi:MAG: hypothetical protein ACR2F9_01575 [Longimicrobiaceae bacterium]